MRHHPAVLPRASPAHPPDDSLLGRKISRGFHPSIHPLSEPDDSAANRVHVPAVFERRVADVEVYGRHVGLDLWDATGHEEHVSFGCPDSRATLVCFAIDPSSSLGNIHRVSFCSFVASLKLNSPPVDSQCALLFPWLSDLVCWLQKGS